LTVLPAVATCALALAGCHDYPDRPAFLCCTTVCTGGLVKVHKDAPVRVDAGWACAQGIAIDYNSPCTLEEGTDCTDVGPEQGGGTGGTGSQDASVGADH
jgi:hypothetical protein